MTRPRIRFAAILDPFVLVLREDDTLGLFVGEPSRGKIRRKDMSALGDKVSSSSVVLIWPSHWASRDHTT